MLKTIDSVIWKRCKSFCSPFEYDNIVTKFNKLHNIEIKLSKNIKKSSLENFNKINSKVLVDLLNDYKELTIKSKVKKSFQSTIKDNKAKNEQRKVRYDYRLLI